MPWNHASEAHYAHKNDRRRAPSPRQLQAATEYRGHYLFETRFRFNVWDSQTQTWDWALTEQRARQMIDWKLETQR